MRQWIANTVACAVLLLLTLAPVFAGDSKDDLKKRFEARHAQLLQLKRNGVIGETYLGFVEAIKGDAGEAANTLMSAENADRRALYQIVAEEENSTPEQVGAQSAIVKFKKAGPNEWFKGKDGVWRQKKDMLK